MPRVVVVLHELFEVVRQSDDVEFQNALVKMDARRVHISVDDTLVVESGHRRRKLSEQT